jgi:hypothetical protein
MIETMIGSMLSLLESLNLIVVACCPAVVCRQNNKRNKNNEKSVCFSFGRNQILEVGAEKGGTPETNNK